LGVIFGVLVILSPYLPIPSDFQKIALVFPFAFTLVILFNNIERLILFVIAVGVPLNLDISVIISPYARNLINVASGRTIVALTELRFSLIMLVVTLGYILWLAGRQGNVRYSIRYFPAITVPALGMILVSTFSLIQAQDKQLALFRIILLLELFLIYFYLANHLRTRQDFQFFIAILMGALLVESILMVIQWRTGLSFSIAGINASIDPQSHRAAGTLGTANSAGVIITAYLVIACAMFWTFQKPWQKVFAVTCFIFGSVALISTAGRAAWGGFVVAILIFIFVAWRRRLVKRRTIIWLLFSILLIGAIFFPSIYTRFTADDSGSAASRLMMNRLAWNLIQANPSHFFFGVGANNYALLAPAYYTADVGDLGYIIDSSVHNTYLLVWAETGLVGLLIFLWLISVPLVKLWNHVYSHNQFISMMALALGCALVAIYIQMLADPFIARPKLIIIWLLFALVASLENLDIERVTKSGYSRTTVKFNGKPNI
jgi:O-antigen ligase